MNLEEILERLSEFGSKQTKKTFINHGASGSLFGVKIGDLKKLVKYVKKESGVGLGII